MATIGPTPQLSQFTQVLRHKGIEDQQLRVSDSGEIKARGNFAAKVVAWLFPSKVEAQNRAVAESFLKALDQDLASKHSKGPLLGQSERLSDSRRAETLATVRESLAGQLSGKVKLTANDVKDLLAWVKDDVGIAVFMNNSAEVDQQLDAVISGYDGTDTQPGVLNWVQDFDAGIKLDSPTLKQLDQWLDKAISARDAASQLTDGFNVEKKRGREVTTVWVEAEVNSLESTIEGKAKESRAQGDEGTASRWDDIGSGIKQWKAQIDDKTSLLEESINYVKHILKNGGDRSLTLDASKPQWAQVPSRLHEPGAQAEAGKSILKDTGHEILIDEKYAWQDKGGDQLPSNQAVSRDLQAPHASELDPGTKVLRSNVRDLTNPGGDHEATKLRFDA